MIFRENHLSKFYRERVKRVSGKHIGNVVLKKKESYLLPHLNPRSVQTRSNVEVRSRINSKSIGGWKNYKDMLQPVMKILTQTYRYRDLTS